MADQAARLDPAKQRLVIETVLITLLVVGTIMRFCHPFIYNPLDFMTSDPGRHFGNALDVKGDNIENITDMPGFEIFLSAVLRVTGSNRLLVPLAFGLLSAVTPWFWYRWFRELTRDRFLSLFGFVFITFLPSWFRVFAYFMDSTLLLPLAGAGLWLTWRAARKGTWQSCLQAACVAGAACATKQVAIPMMVIPWFFVGYRLSKKLPRLKAITMAVTSAFIVLCFYGLEPLKVWTHVHAIVLMPKGIYNQRYFESGAHDIMVTSTFNHYTGGYYISCCIWGSPSVCYPPFYPFSHWMTKRSGRYNMEIDYRLGDDYCKPIYMKLSDRLHYTWENILFFFFQMHWPEDGDYDAPFPRNLLCMSRFLFLPLTLVCVGWFLSSRRRDFIGWYFIIITLLFMFQQSAVMEGRYKKIWEGVPVGLLLYLIAGSKRYQRWQSGGSAISAEEPLKIEAAPPVVNV